MQNLIEFIKKFFLGKKTEKKKEITIVEDWWVSPLSKDFKKTEKLTTKGGPEVTEIEEETRNSVTDSLQKTVIKDVTLEHLDEIISRQKTVTSLDDKANKKMSKDSSYWWKAYSTKDRALSVVAVIFIVINAVLTTVSAYFASPLAIYFGITAILLYHYRRLLRK